MRGTGTEATDRAARKEPVGHCPPEGELSAFSRGALPLAALHSIAEHVSVCAACDSKVSTLVSELAHRHTGVHQGASAAAESGQLDLAEARIDSSAPSQPAVEEEGPTAPLRLGQYRLVRQIGRGGMGVVYQARHERLHRDVAIKFVPIETVQDLFDVERLQREMAAAGTMRHPNVVYATDAGESEGVQYLVMEYVEGIDLSKLVAAVGGLKVADACEIIRQAADGLAHVEQQQLVHRDLKPSNLMLSADGTVKILDLGLARKRTMADDAGELTTSGYLLGTIDYVAPEQARDAHAADIRSDIYGLGCTFYKLLTGGPPFGGAGKSVASKILAHEQQPPPPLSQHRGDVPPEVEQVLVRMLAKDPAERFQSPLELKRAIRPLAAGADLPALLAKAQVAPRPANAPRSAQDTSRPTTIESAPEKEATIARTRARPRAALAGAGAAMLIAVLLGGLWLSGWLPGVGSGGKSGQRPSPTVEDVLASPHSGQIDYPFPEDYPETLGKVTRAGPGALTLESDYIQLVRLGYLRDNAERLSFEIDQANFFWRGNVGVFLGYHEYRADVVDKAGQPYHGDIGEFQLFLLELATGNAPHDNYLQVRRTQARVFPYQSGGAPDLYYGPWAMSAHRIRIPKPNETLPIVIEFTGRGSKRKIARIEIGGDVLDDLSDLPHPPPEIQLTPRDFDGAVGLFNFGDMGGATFSNFDLSNLEKE